MIYLTMFLTFFRIGLFTFGGGYAMLPLIQQAVLQNGWLEETQLINFIAVSESTPGPFAVNIATYIGSCMGGVFGSVCATLGVAMPSFIVILIVARCYLRFRSSKIVAGCMSGLKPAVVGLIAAALLTVGKTVFFVDGVSTAVLGTPIFWLSLLLCAAAAVMAFKKVHPILIILISAAVGIGMGYLFL